MKPPPDPHYRHRFPAEIISQAVWLYHVFSLSLRDVELLLAERGVVASYETIRRWCKKFGQTFAGRLRRRRPPLCQRSCRLNRIGTFGGADSRKWLDTDKRTKIG